MTGLFYQYVSVFCKLSFVVCCCRRWLSNLEMVVYHFPHANLIGKLYVHVQFVKVPMKIVNLIFVSSGKRVANVGWPKKCGLCISN